MKKKAIFVITVVIFAICASGCASAMEKRISQISELRNEVLVGGDENVKVTVFSGKREDPFEIDGKISQSVTPFTVVTVDGTFTGEVNYTLYLGQDSYEGTLVKHPFKDRYSVEIAVKSPKVATLTVESNGFVGNYELKSVKTEQTISASDALEIAEERLKKSIDKMEKGGKLNAEIYVRLLENPISSEGGYYWYVAYVPQKYEVYAVLIHSINGQIVAVRE